MHGGSVFLCPLVPPRTARCALTFTTPALVRGMAERGAGRPDVHPAPLQLSPPRPHSPHSAPALGRAAWTAAASAARHLHVLQLHAPPTPPRLLPVPNSLVPGPSGTRGGRAARRQRRSPPPLRHPPCRYLCSYGRPPPLPPVAHSSPPSQPSGTPTPHVRAHEAADSYTGGGGFTAAGPIPEKGERGRRRRWRWSGHCGTRAGQLWEGAGKGRGGEGGAGSRSERALPVP